MKDLWVLGDLWLFECAMEERCREVGAEGKKVSEAEPESLFLGRGSICYPLRRSVYSSIYVDDGFLLQLAL